MRRIFLLPLMCFVSLVVNVQAQGGAAGVTGGAGTPGAAGVSGTTGTRGTTGVSGTTGNSGVSGVASTVGDGSVASSPAESGVHPPQLIVADGQLLSHPFQVFVTYSVTEAMKPTLRLTGSHLLTEMTPLEKADLQPSWTFPRQFRSIEVNGQQVPTEGTLLIFNLNAYDEQSYADWLKAAVRYLPVLSWTDPPTKSGLSGTKRSVAGESEIYVGNLIGGVFWTVVVVGLIVVMLVRWSVSNAKKITAFKPRPIFLLITGHDGYLSLWRTQLLLWTIAVGSVVLLFGLLRLHVPEIPEQLVALMGMSLLTGTVSAIKTKSNLPAVPAANAAAQPQDPTTAPTPPTPVQFNPSRPELADLISTWNKTTQQVELSMPKAQMVFWTAIILGLFVVKSILGGSLWPVPWEMVALTGMSQAGYIGDKFVQSSQ